MLNMNIKAAALTAVLASTCASALPTDLSERQVAVPYPPFSDGQANKYCVSLEYPRTCNHFCSIHLALSHLQKEWRWAGRALPPINVSQDSLAYVTNEYITDLTFLSFLLLLPTSLYTCFDDFAMYCSPSMTSSICTDHRRAALN